MIKLYMAAEEYEQDIRPLVKSFFPDEELEVEYKLYTGTIEELQTENKCICFLAGEKDIRLLYVQGTEVFEREKKQVDEPENGSAAEDAAVVWHKHYRDELKRALYRLLSRVTGKTLPWGTLTGIRPTKQVLELLEEQEAEEEIRRLFTEKYYCSVEKQDLSLQVAKKELALLQDLDYKESYSLYIGIPFCPTTCLYCSFTSYPLEKFRKYTDVYLEALKKEIAYAAECFPHKKLVTVYFGGGTPTTLSAEQLRDLIQTVKKHFPLQHLKEWTVEAGRPDSITEEKLRVLLEEGITRISINPQTMQQKTLDLVGRRHTVEQIIEAFTLARKMGFDNINMDLIIGLTGEEAEDVRDTLRQIKELSPDSVTVHTLALKRAARLNVQKEQYKEKKATGVNEMLEASVAFAKENGYEPYYLYRQKNMAENLENVGYARPGKEGLYNILIMEEKHTILALGAGASTKIVFPGGKRIERVENVKSLLDYIERIDEMIERKRTFLKSVEGQL